MIRMFTSPPDTATVTTSTTTTSNGVIVCRLLPIIIILFATSIRNSSSLRFPPLIPILPKRVVPSSSDINNNNNNNIRNHNRKRDVTSDQISTITIPPRQQSQSRYELPERPNEGHTENATNNNIINNNNEESEPDRVQRIIHETLMDLALDEAQKAGTLGEVPIGAIVIQTISSPTLLHNTNTNSPPTSNTTSSYKYKYKLLSTGQNQIETNHDASAHAELQSLRMASHTLQNWRLNATPYNTTLYTTLEPCPMCLSAAQAFRVGSVVYGAPDLRLGAVEGRYMALLGDKSGVVHPFHPGMEVVGGVRGDECGRLLVEFFRERRRGRKKGNGITKGADDVVVIPDAGVVSSSSSSKRGRIKRFWNYLTH